MKYLLVKEKGNNFQLYSPDTYGMETWGGLSQSSIVKKKKHWYISHWTTGNDWIEDTNEDYKLNVVLETPDLDEILKYIINSPKYTQALIRNILVDAQKIYTDYINFTTGILCFE